MPNNYLAIWKGTKHKWENKALKSNNSITLDDKKTNFTSKEINIIISQKHLTLF